MADVTYTVKSSGGDYASLNAAFAGLNGVDLTTDNGSGNPGNIYLDCYNFEDTTACSISATITTSATYRVIVRAVDDHGGVWSTSCYRLVNSAATITNNSVNYLMLDGIQCNLTSAGSNASGYQSGTSLDAVGQTEIDKLIVMGPSSKPAAPDGIWNSEPLHDIWVRNSLLYGLQNGIGNAGTGAKIIAENVTIDDCYQGVYNSYGGHKLTNVRVTNCTVVCSTVSNIDSASDYNLTDGDASGVTYWGTNSIDSSDTPTIDYVDDTNATLASRDYHLNSTADSGYGAGTDLSGTFTDDIDGETRSSWDIGADEYSVGGGGGGGAFTTTQSGNWSSTATWGGSGPPGDGDTATVNHAVTVNTNTTIGDSPGDSTSIVLTLNAALTIASGVTLTVKGNVLQTNGINADVSAGGGITFDSSGASPTTTTYVWTLGTGHNANPVGRLSFNGTSGSRCTCQSNTSGGNGRFSNGGWLRGGMVVATYTDFYDIGDASNYGFSPYPSSTVCPSLVVTHCTFDGCGEFRQAGHSVDGYSTIINDNNFKNGLGSYSFFLSHYSAPLTSGTRSFQRNYVDKTIGYNLKDYTIEDNVIATAGSPVALSATGQMPASFKNNLIWKEQVGSANFPFNCLNNYFITDTDTTNPHFVSLPHASNTGVVNTTHDGWIFEYTGSSAVGDCMGMGSPSEAKTVTVQNCIVLPNQGTGDQSGTMITCAGGSFLTVKALHNTFCVEGSQHGYSTGVTVGETYAGHAGMIAELKSNLAWAVTSGDGALTAEEPTDPVADIVTASGADYNCSYLCGGRYAGQGPYEVTFSTASYGVDYGANDVDENPSFLDNTRNSATWDASLGGTGTTTNMMAEFRLMNTGAWNTSYNPQALHQWVKAGWAPTNANLDGAAHDSGTIGAVAYASGSTPTAPTGVSVSEVSGVITTSWTDQTGGTAVHEVGRRLTTSSGDYFIVGTAPIGDEQLIASNFPNGSWNVAVRSRTGATFSAWVVAPQTVTIGDAGGSIDEFRPIANRSFSSTASRQSGIGQHGDSVTFSPAFVDTPVVVIRGGAVSEPRTANWSDTSFSTTIPVYMDRKAVNLDNTGFDLRAQLYQKTGTATLEHVGFAAGSIRALDWATTTKEANLTTETLPAHDDSYTVTFDVNITLSAPTLSGKPPRQVTLNLAIQSYDNATEGWITRATHEWVIDADYDIGDVDVTYSNINSVLSVSGFEGTDDKIRLKVTNWSGDTAYGSFSVTGNPDTDPYGVSWYSQSTANRTASMTPDAEDFVEWDAFLPGAR